MTKDELTKDFINTIKQAEDTELIAINSFLAGVNFIQELKKTKETA